MEPMALSTRERVMTLIESNMIERMLFASRANGVDMALRPHAASFRTGIAYPSVFLNMIWTRYMACTDVDPGISEAARRAASEHAPLFWGVDGESAVCDVDSYLGEMAFAPVETVWGMAMRLSEFAGPHPLPDNVTIQPVRDADGLSDFLRVLAGGDSGATVHRWLEYERKLHFDDDSPWQRFVAYLDGDPAGTSAAFLGSQVAGIYHVETVETARGRGIGTAVTAAAVVEAVRRGYDEVVLVATPMGYPIYRKLGFDEYSALRLYALQPED